MDYSLFRGTSLGSFSEGALSGSQVRRMFLIVLMPMMALVGCGGDEGSSSSGAGATTADGTPTEGWKYNTDDGTFICNYGSATTSDSSVNYDDL